MSVCRGSRRLGRLPIKTPPAPRELRRSLRRHISPRLLHVLHSARHPTSDHSIYTYICQLTSLYDTSSLSAWCMLHPLLRPWHDIPVSYLSNSSNHGRPHYAVWSKYVVTEGQERATTGQPTTQSLWSWSWILHVRSFSPSLIIFIDTHFNAISLGNHFPL
jgi:hypothetical protein